MDDSGPVVIVELAAEATKASNVGTLIDACTVALRRGECTLPVATTQSPDAVAIVSFRSSDPTEVLVEVRSLRANGQSTSRDLVFRREDSEGEQWRSIGFTIASLVGALGVHEAPRPPVYAPRARPAAPERKPEPRRPIPVPISPFHVGARFELGPGLDRGPIRLGGAFVVGVDLPGRVLSVWALAADAFRSEAVGAVDMTWTRVGIGLSAAVPLSFVIEGRVALGVVLERLSATEVDAATQAEQSRSRWLSGAELDGSLRFPRATTLGALVGGYVVRLSGGTAVVSHGVELASSPATEGGFFAGVEVRL